ncbi:MAG TPA: branched-chain amino acid ABC transporter permease [Candidatus Pullichristensenella avicola]|nr:branched-chain amino acid ABC transporter permease [Candidatus Pullichristensenella avicola]
MRAFRSSRLARPLALIVLAIAFIVGMPRISSVYNIMVMDSAILYFIASLGISILLGMGGQLSFATASLMGFGAFMSALYSKNLGVPSALAIALATLSTAALALFLGLALLRLRGAYFTFATISFAYIATSIYNNYKPFTGGADGVINIPTLTIGQWSPGDLYGWFYVLMAVAVACFLLVERIRGSYFGRALASIRDNEIAAQTLGINVFATKVMAFTIAGALAGLAGALYAHFSTVVSQAQFTFDISVNMLLMVMIGGVDSTFGTFLGAILITMLPEWLRPLRNYMRLIYGVGIILLMVFMPYGLTGILRSALGKVRGKALSRKSDLQGGT